MLKNAHQAALTVRGKGKAMAEGLATPSISIAGFAKFEGHLKVILLERQAPLRFAHNDYV